MRKPSKKTLKRVDKARRRVYLNCKYCNKEFWLPLSKIKRDYCSMGCSSKGRTKKVKRECKTCGKEFEIVPSQFKFYKGAGKYCSRKCSYKGIIKETKKKPIKDKYGRSKRKADRVWQKEVREKESYTCKKCGIFQKYIHTHHIKPRSRYPELKHDIENGICLCNSCHTWVHHHPKESHELGYLYVGKYDN